MIDPTSPHDPQRRAWRTDREWARLSARLATAETVAPTRRSSVIALWASAAGVLFVAATSASVVRLAMHGRAAAAAGERVTGVATTSAGKRTVVHLADSSVVTLGPSSTVRYTLSRTARDVVLDGMAEFRVVHDTSRRFVVRARNAVVTDVGTEFFVRAYATDSNVRVAVTSGVVSLAGSASDSGRVVLRAHDVGVIQSGGRPAIVAGADASQYTEWIDGRLAFDNESLERVAVELSRWFGVNVRVESRALARRRVSGTYLAPTVGRVVDALAATLDADVARSDSVVVFREKRR